MDVGVAPAGGAVALGAGGGVRVGGVVGAGTTATAGVGTTTESSGVGVAVEAAVGRGGVVSVVLETVISGRVEVATGVKVTAGATVGVGCALRAIGVGAMLTRRGPSASGRISPTTSPPTTTSVANSRDSTTRYTLLPVPSSRADCTTLGPAPQTVDRRRYVRVQFSEERGWRGVRQIRA